MHISSADIILILERLDPESDEVLCAILQALKGLIDAAAETDSTLDSIEQRLSNLEGS